MHLVQLSLLFLLTAALHTSGLNVEEFEMENNGIGYHGKGQRPGSNTGHAVICGPPNATLGFSWEPKVAFQSEEVKISVNVTAPVTIMSGLLSGEVYIPEVKSKIFEYNYPFDCRKLARKYPVLCPVHKGKQFHISGFSYKLQAFPVGIFDVHGTIVNEKGELFACFKVTIHVKE